jgi:catechol 2,3-dioxygenase-like lactoylglutathione lyase family enzyme
MIDHISLCVTDLERARSFYDAVLKPLGYERRWNTEDSSGYGKPVIHHQALPFWIGQDDTVPPWAGHLCFTAPSRAAVDAFYEAALAAGARDNGAPGLRPQYHATYYAAFVVDPDAHRIEAVCHQSE